MSGVAIICRLLLDHAALAAVVPPDRTCAGDLPIGVSLPAISVKQVSGIDWQALTPGTTVRSTDRVRVMVKAKTYPQQKQIIALVRAAAANKLGDIAGATRVAVHTEGVGPDLEGEGGVFSQPQDFRVSYNLQA